MYDFQQYFNIMQIFQTWGYDQTMKSQTRETPVSTDSNIPGMGTIFILNILVVAITHLLFLFSNIKVLLS